MVLSGIIEKAILVNLLLNGLKFVMLNMQWRSKHKQLNGNSNEVVLVRVNEKTFQLVLVGAVKQTALLFSAKMVPTLKEFLRMFVRRRGK